MLEFGVVNCVVILILRNEVLEQNFKQIETRFFSYAHFVRCKNQSVWKACAPLPCQKRITCSPIDQGDTESSVMSVLKGTDTQELENQSSAHQSGFPPQETLFSFDCKTSAHYCSSNPEVIVVSQFRFISMPHLFCFKAAMLPLTETKMTQIL